MKKAEKKLVDEIVRLSRLEKYSANDIVKNCSFLHQVFPAMGASDLVINAVNILDKKSENHSVAV